MKKLKIQRAAVLVLVLALILIPKDISARVRSAVIQVDGLTCPFCAYGLEKKLKKIPGVKNFKVNMRAGEATLSFKKKASVKLSALRQAVKDAAFTPKKIRITVEGSLGAFNDKTGNYDTIEDSGIRFILLPSEEKQNQEGTKLQKRWRTLGKNRNFVVTGIVRKFRGEEKKLRPSQNSTLPLVIFVEKLSDAK